MKKFILKRVLQYTESSEIVADSFEAAKDLLEGGIELEYGGEDVTIDQSVEFIGEVE